MHILIVEDEPVVAKRLLRLIEKILGSRIQRIHHIARIDEAEDYLSEQAVDLLFLDLNLFGRDGFELLCQKIAGSFHTIIVSAYAEKAAQAFEYEVLDFIVKPFNQKRLEKALGRLNRVQGREAPGLKYLSLRLGSVRSLVDIESIEYIRADGHYSELHYDGKTSLHDKSIEALQSLLPGNFVRIHRSYIANINCVNALKKLGGGVNQLELKSGECVPVSRSRVKDIELIFR
ncbi:LytTR family DNA-binding domain-containing protein [Gilvimarinus sp. SDUM040013]|uniref:LytTR family DNA-binding domain-containing protein n=1 Tax=Gilvimarinus gilvus TaxID=3058038 RepID=A0ABU4S3J4_9GAMM|nr:LytTR family DNA-binding domain-containing protein [Gilvimarinus sp. SDUM040013]MDO3388068.1 LytTR family DNA-binding domain-containing protein [Gilvimarinus sp. SDUM040013]MDX6850976.1 LytTR family DNA-binding domain-containing protein [Gilvimarinus sp. SDUM040013]